MKSVRSAYSRTYLFVSPILLAALLLVAAPVPSALAGDCDGTAGIDNFTCSANPTNPDTDIDLGDSNDTLIVAVGVTTGEISGGLGDDIITINGDADAHSISQVNGDNAGGDGGNDTITINGYVNHQVAGDDSSGDGGADTIVVNGSVSGYVVGDDVGSNGGADIISITSTGTVVGVTGDSSGTSGNADTITVDGHVQDDVIGDSTSGDGGADMIIINGVVDGDVLGDDVGGAGGGDTVILGVDGVVAGIIDGEDGVDVLKFNALTPAQLAALGLDPAGDSTTINCHKYTWLNFETLVGAASSPLQFVVCGVNAAEHSLHVYFASDALLAIASNDGAGISVFAEHGRIAFISFANVAALAQGEVASYSTPNSAGWYVTVANLGADLAHTGHTLFQVSIYAAGGSLSAQFTFSN